MRECTVVNSEVSDQTGQILWLIRVFTGCTGYFVIFVMNMLNCCFGQSLKLVMKIVLLL